MQKQASEAFQIKLDTMENEDEKKLRMVSVVSTLETHEDRRNRATS
jgi:hypothetical protein